MQRGRVNRLKNDRGFGFIRGGDGRDVFFHRSSVADDGFDDLREGQEVTYEFEDSPKGPRANQVTPA